MVDDIKNIFLFKEDPMVAGLVLVGPLIEPDPTVATPLKVKMGEGLGIPSPPSISTACQLLLLSKQHYYICTMQGFQWNVKNLYLRPLGIFDDLGKKTFKN